MLLNHLNDPQDAGQSQQRIGADPFGRDNLSGVGRRDTSSQQESVQHSDAAVAGGLGYLATNEDASRNLPPASKPFIFSSIWQYC